MTPLADTGNLTRRRRALTPVPLPVALLSNALSRRRLAGPGGPGLCADMEHASASGSCSGSCSGSANGSANVASATGDCSAIGGPPPVSTSGGTVTCPTLVGLLWDPQISSLASDHTWSLPGTAGTVYRYTVVQQAARHVSALGVLALSCRSVAFRLHRTSRQVASLLANPP